MTRREINHIIFCVERDIADIAARICNAEKSIGQLQRLKECCMDYLRAFEDCKYNRKQKVKDLLCVEGQEKLIGDYTDVMEEILMGSEYLCAYDGAETAVYDIECEIEKQELFISEYREQQISLQHSVVYWKRELTDAKEE